MVVMSRVAASRPTDLSFKILYGDLSGPLNVHQMKSLLNLWNFLLLPAEKDE